MLDFALACSAPGDVDFAIYLVQNDWLIDATNDEIVDDWLELVWLTGGRAHAENRTRLY